MTVTAFVRLYYDHHTFYSHKPVILFKVTLVDIYFDSFVSKTYLYEVLH
jgi:hypothetical protein